MRHSLRHGTSWRVLHKPQTTNKYPSSRGTVSQNIQTTNSTIHKSSQIIRRTSSDQHKSYKITLGSFWSKSGKIGQNDRIFVSEYDKSPLDLRNVIGVVVGKKEGNMKKGGNKRNKFGYFTEQFARYQFQPCQSSHCFRNVH